MAENNYGILASVDWNSNQWKDLSTPEDLNHSNYGIVTDNGVTYTSLDFAHNEYPTDSEGLYQGFLPQLFTKTPDKEKSRLVQIVFVKSQEPLSKDNFIIGFYAFPVFQKGLKPSPIEVFTGNFDFNIKALPKNIHLLENYINLNSYPIFEKFLPKGKRLGKEVYNYLPKENVYKILDTMTSLNPSDKKLSGIKYRLITSIDSMKYSV
jgi:hypothetical protein